MFLPSFFFEKVILCLTDWDGDLKVEEKQKKKTKQKQKHFVSFYWIHFHASCATVLTIHALSFSDRASKDFEGKGSTIANIKSLLVHVPFSKQNKQFL